MLKNYVLREDTSTKTMKMAILKIYLSIIFGLWFKFLTVYICLVLEKKAQNVFILRNEDNSFPTLSSSEDESPCFINPTRKWNRSNKRLLTFPKFQSVENQTKKKKGSYDYCEFVKSFEPKNIEKLKIKFEIEEFIRLILENLFIEAIMLKTSGRFRETFLVLNQTLTLSKNFENISVC